jgi:hypothetical protein
MSFNPNQDHSITLAEAADMTEAFRTSNPTEKIGGFFGKTAIESILNQPNAVGLKFYFARNNGELTLVLCGAESNQNDLYNGVLAEDALGDPPYASAPNPLNS